MTSVTETAGPTPLVERLSQVLEDIRKANSVTYVTLFLAVVFGFPSWYFQFSVQLALLIVLLVPSTAKRPALWGLLAIMASITIVLERDLADNHKYLLCYWLWVMCIAHIPDGSELRDQIIRIQRAVFPGVHLPRSGAAEIPVVELHVRRHVRAGAVAGPALPRLRPTCRH